MTGATTVPILQSLQVSHIQILSKTDPPPKSNNNIATYPLKACEKLILISEYFGGPQTVMYGFAAVSKLPNPFPIIKIAAQKPPNDLYKMQGQATRDPTPYKHKPQMKVAL